MSDMGCKEASSPTWTRLHLELGCERGSAAELTPLLWESTAIWLILSQSLVHGPGYRLRPDLGGLEIEVDSSLDSKSSYVPLLTSSTGSTSTSRQPPQYLFLQFLELPQ